MKRICNKCGMIADKNHKCKVIGKVIKAKQKKHDKDFDNSDSTRWRKFRRTILQRDGHHCVRCYIKYKRLTTTQLEVHHIKDKKTHPELTYIKENCITLCKWCHHDFKQNQPLDFKYDKLQEQREYIL